MSGQAIRRLDVCGARLGSFHYTALSADKALANRHHGVQATPHRWPAPQGCGEEWGARGSWIGRVGSIYCPERKATVKRRDQASGSYSVGGLQVFQTGLSN
ncbi:hypothetical protein HJFPF1_05165 [Paramyrothecium foliicola]|nr:hypothetical protein HJFPF1_05165 [Paramyrothecium foliicola]